MRTTTNHSGPGADFSPRQWPQRPWRAGWTCQDVRGEGVGESSKIKQAGIGISWDFMVILWDFMVILRDSRGFHGILW